MQAAAAGGICRSRPALCPAPGRGWAGRSGTGSQSSLVVLLFKPRAAAGLSLSSPGVPKACAPLCHGGLCECRPHRTAGGTMSDLPSLGAGPKAWPLLVPVKQDQCERDLPGAGRVRLGSWPQRPGLQRLSKQPRHAVHSDSFIVSTFPTKKPKPSCRVFFFLPQITKLTYSSRNPETNTVLGERAAL